MKFLSFVRDGKPGYGAVVGDGVVDLGRRHGDWPDLRAAIRADALPALAAEAAGTEPDFALAGVDYLPTIPNPEKIICIGVNYANRSQEYEDATEASYPSVFMRTADSLVGHDAPLLRPPESVQLDYEGEIVIVVGEGGRRIPAASAEAHIAGLTIMNEGTIRDWVRHAKFNVTQGKNFGSSGAIGPWIVTADEFDRYDDFTLTTRVNGEVRQHDTTANLTFSFARLISYLSTFFTLRPGDVIATGTPLGAGARHDPPRWLVPGDVVEVEVPGIGTLRNPVEDEAA